MKYLKRLPLFSTALALLTASALTFAQSAPVTPEPASQGGGHQHPGVSATVPKNASPSAQSTAGEPSQPDQPPAQNQQQPAIDATQPLPTEEGVVPAEGTAGADTLIQGPPEQAQESPLLSKDLSPWGMYLAADKVVKTVMIGLALASIATWTIWLIKVLELFRARRLLRRDMTQLKQSRTLDQAARALAAEKTGGLGRFLVEDAHEEIHLSSDTDNNDGLKERVGARLERLIAATSRSINRGTGVLATVGSVSPFVGLFGTVWGIMNSFIGIAHSQTTNLAVVAPGIAEALLATAIGLVAAIPAVILYNAITRSIGGYRALAGDAAALVLLLLSRDLDTPGLMQARKPSAATVKAV